MKALDPVRGVFPVLLATLASAQVTQRISVSGAGAQASGSSFSRAISPDGRFVAFTSSASDLVAGDVNGLDDVFVRDRQLGTTERVSVDSAGVQGNSFSATPSISADGRFVTFESHATNLVAGDTNGQYDLFLRDRQLGTTERVSVSSGGAQSNLQSFRPSTSADGRFMVFWSVATNLVGGDTNATGDVFVRDRQLGTTERASLDSAGNQGNGESRDPSISADGRTVAFESGATNLVGGDTNGLGDIFVRDRQLGTTERVSVDSAGAQGNAGSFIASISADGRCVAFTSSASNLVVGDTNGFVDAFVRDRQLAVTELVSRNWAGAQASAPCTASSISTDGRYVAFNSAADDLVLADTNASHDGFLRDRTGGPSFTSLCDPGAGGVTACPCSNPRGGPFRGCDNSSGTGGATLSASSGTYLSSDSLVFTTTGEKPTALSIVSQWTGVNPTGAVFGQGVRCTSGTLKRLYNKTASGGSITAPSFGAGDPQVSVRSATLGDTILAGQSRWYLVYYRDPIVLGGCPPSSTFNATQTGAIAWSP